MAVKARLARASSRSAVPVSQTLFALHFCSGDTMTRSAGKEAAFGLVIRNLHTWGHLTCELNQTCQPGVIAVGVIDAFAVLHNCWLSSFVSIRLHTVRLEK
jgi:hypothetical protein